MGWKQIAGCSADGPREAHLDRGCAAEIDPSGLRGYCDCGGGVRASPLSCSLAAAAGYGGDGDDYDDDAGAAAGRRPTRFTCREACDRQQQDEPLASVAVRARALSDADLRVLQRRHERRLERLNTEFTAAQQQAIRVAAAASTGGGGLGSGPSAGASAAAAAAVAAKALNGRGRRVCVGGFVETNPQNCGSIESALVAWHQSLLLRPPGQQSPAPPKKTCAAPITAGVSGVCFCSEGVLAAVACKATVRSCDDACAVGGAAGLGGRPPARWGVTFYLAPTAGARIGLGVSDVQAVLMLDPVTSAAQLREMEVQRRFDRLVAIESHSLAVSAAQSLPSPRPRDDDADIKSIVKMATAMLPVVVEPPPPLPLLIDVAVRASERAHQLRRMRRDALGLQLSSSSNPRVAAAGGGQQRLSAAVAGRASNNNADESVDGNGGGGGAATAAAAVAGGGHAGSALDAAFDADVERQVRLRGSVAPELAAKVFVSGSDSALAAYRHDREVMAR